jgi:23S rRNA pseudouridine2605 synthase
MKLEDGATAPARARLVAYSREADTSTVELTIHEGRKRQVRRMFETVGHRVDRLTRTRLGCLDLRGLAEGHSRRLTRGEIADLRRLAEPKAQSPKRVLPVKRVQLRRTREGKDQSRNAEN